MKNLFIFIFLLSFGNLFAADAPSNAAMQTQAGLYVTALEAYAMLQDKDLARVVLIDVRDPAEIMFTGFATPTEIHVPYQIVNTSIIDEKNKVYQVETNRNFADEVESHLAELKVNKDAHLIFMCRSGSTRSAPAADIFYARGWKNVYSMVDGFQGDKVKSGAQKGMRVKDGWINSGLPWSSKMNPEVMYLTLE